MARSRYESKEDVDLQNRIGAYLAKKMMYKGFPSDQWDMYERNSMYDIDYVMEEDNGTQVLVEIKNRNPKFEGIVKKDGLMLSTIKYNNLKALHAATGSSVLLVAAFAPRLYIHFINKDSELTVHSNSGRTNQRRDCVKIPLEMFTVINEGFTAQRPTPSGSEEELEEQAELLSRYGSTNVA